MRPTILLAAFVIFGCSSSDAPDPCALAQGKYRVVYSNPRPTSCAVPDPQTVDMPGGTIASASSTGGGCQIATDHATCTMTSTCTTVVDAKTTKVSMTFSSQTLRGSMTVDSDGTSCAWDYQYTKL